MNLTVNTTADYRKDNTGSYKDVDLAVVSTYICLVGVLGFLGNSWVITAFCRHRYLRTSTNIFIVHLAGCDLLLALLELVFSLPSSVNHGWLFGEVACRTFGFAYHFLSAMSLNTLAVISLDRFWVIAKPSFGAKITVKRAVLCVVLTHFYTLVFTLPVIFGWVGFYEEKYFTFCYLNFQTKSEKTLTYSISRAVFLFSVPFGVMVYCYCSIFLSVRRRSRRNTRKKTVARKQRRSWKSISPHWRTARMIIVVISVFLLCWSPHVIISICLAFGMDSLTFVQEITVLLAKSVIIYNPFIYAVLNHRFRKAFLGMCCKNCRNFDAGECNRTPVVSGGLSSSFRIPHTSGNTWAKVLCERLSEKELELDCATNDQCKLKRYCSYKTRMNFSSFENYANGRLDSSFSGVKNGGAQMPKCSSTQDNGDKNEMGFEEPGEGPRLTKDREVWQQNIR